MADKSEEILTAINMLRTEMTEQITAAVRVLQEAISQTQAAASGKVPISASPPVASFEQAVLARNLKQYCVDTLPQLEQLLVQAKEKGQDLAAVQRLVSRVGEHATSTQEDLAGRGALLLRTEIEKLQTTINILRTSVASAPKPAAAIPFPPATQRETPGESAAKKSAAAQNAKRTTISSAEQARSASTAGKEKKTMAASAKAS